MRSLLKSIITLLKKGLLHKMANGFIYIMSNPSFSDGKIKIGKSQKDPSFRKEELNSTGVPEPFEIEYFALVENYDDVELIVHSRLDNCRPNKNREFFTCSIPEAILAIRQASQIKYEEVLYKSPEEIYERQKQKEEEEQAEKDRLEKEKILEEQRQKEEAAQKHREMINSPAYKRKLEKKKRKDEELEAWNSFMHVYFVIFLIVVGFFAIKAEFF